MIGAASAHTPSKWFLAIVLCGVCTVSLAQQDDSYLRSEFDRVWDEYKQNALAENHEAALRFARRAYEFANGDLTLDPVLIAEITAEFGTALLMASKASESMSILELALRRTESVYGARSTKLISVLISLADASGTNQRQPAQRLYLARAENILVNEYGAGSIAHADFSLDAGILILDDFVSLTAGAYLENATRTYSEMLPPTHPNVGTAQYYLGYYHLVRNDAKTARSHFAIAAKVLPRDIADLADLRYLARKHLVCINTILRKDPDFIPTKFRKKESADAKLKDLIPILRVAPIYPATALRAGIEGYVEVEFTLNEQGRPIDIELLYRCNGPHFDAASIQAVRLFEYEPVMRDGEAVSYPGVTSRIRYELEP